MMFYLLIYVILYLMFNVFCQIAKPQASSCDYDHLKYNIFFLLLNATVSIYFSYTATPQAMLNQNKLTVYCTGT